MNEATGGVRHILMKRGGEVFDLSKRLPDLVHRLSTGAAPLFDGDFVFGPSAWPMVSSLAGLHGDSSVHLLTLEPGEEDFLEAGECGAFTVPVASTPDAYTEGLFGTTPNTGFMRIGYVADVVALFGDSGRWGIWVERNVVGLVATDHPSELALWELEHGPFASVEEAIDDFLALNIGVGPQVRSFASELQRNYGVFGMRN